MAPFVTALATRDLETISRGLLRHAETLDRHWCCNQAGTGESLVFDNQWNIFIMSVNFISIVHCRHHFHQLRHHQDFHHHHEHNHYLHNPCHRHHCRFHYHGCHHDHHFHFFIVVMMTDNRTLFFFLQSYVHI